MKKNSQLHIPLETELLGRIKAEAEKNCTNMSELVRTKMRKCDLMQEILLTLKSIERKVYSSS